MKKLSLLLMSAVFACGIASADIIPVIAGAPTGPSGGFYTWTWNASVDATSKVETGSYFTIYDIGGFGPGDVVSSGPGFTATVALTGTTPATTLPSDDPGIYNVTWTYSGTTILGAASLGAFSIRSTQNFSRLDHYASLSTNQTNNTPQGNVGSTSVPGSGVPEPATMVLFGGGLTGLGLLARRRKA